MREVIKKLLRESIFEKYKNQIIDSIKEYGLPVKITAYSKTKVEYVDGSRTFVQVPYGDVEFELPLTVGDPFFRTLIASDENGAKKFVFKNLCEMAGKKPEDVRNIMDLQSDSNNSVFLIYEEGVMYLAQETMGCTHISGQEELGDAVLIRDKVWPPGGPYFSGVNNLSRMRIVNCNLWVGADLEFLGGLSEVRGNLHFKSCNNLDTLRIVSGKLKIEKGEMISLEKLKSVGSTLHLGNELNKLNSLGSLEEVGGDFIIQCPNLKSLGKLKYVGGKLRLRKSGVEDLGDLEKVEGTILVDRTIGKKFQEQIKNRGFKMVKG